MTTALKIFYYAPILGWMLRDAIRGAPDAIYYFAFNVVTLFAYLVYAFGYPLVISVALAGAASALTGLVAITASDAFAKDRPHDVYDRDATRRRRSAGKSRGKGR